MKRKILILFFGFLLFFPFAQQVEETVVAYADSANYQTEKDYIATDSILKTDYKTSNTTYPKTIDPNFKSKYKGPEFDYTTIKPKESLWEKLKRKLEKFLESIFGEVKPGAINDITLVAFRVIAIVVIGFFLYLIISYLVDKDGNFFFSKKNRKVHIRSGELHENIHEINFPETIANFERAKDFRSAVRYHFLYLLKKLNDGNIIVWNPEKTNKDYIKEISKTEHRDKYVEFAYYFDNVWYGEHTIDEPQYMNLRKNFIEAKF